MNYIIPFDDAIGFHQGMGIFGVFLAAVHSVSHIANFILCAASSPRLIASGTASAARSL